MGMGSCAVAASHKQQCRLLVKVVVSRTISKVGKSCHFIIKNKRQAKDCKASQQDILLIPNRPDDDEELDINRSVNNLIQRLQASETPLKAIF